MAQELDRDCPLFNDFVAVQVKFPDHEKTLRLTIRVLQGSRATPTGGTTGQKEGVLHIEVTDESDFFFLYTLQVGEDDYHQLKHDQCLLVDFKSFPRKFIELLENCRASVPGEGCLWGDSRRRDERGTGVRSATDPSFLARLETHVPGGYSVFSVVETNPFKELTHLSLKFRAGNDDAIKTYLAARLQQVKAEAASLSATLEATRASLVQEEAHHAQVAEQVSSLRVDRERDLRDLRAANSEELTAAREEGLRKLEEAAAARTAEMEAHRRKAEADLHEVSQRLRQSEQRREELTDLKFAHEAELRDLRCRSEADEAGREAATSDAKALREANRVLEARAIEAEREAERLRMQRVALEQQLADAKEMLSKSQALQDASKATVARLEETQEAYKGSVVALQERIESSVSEINRGNAIIQRLQGQYRSLKAKAKLKNEVIKQQERLLAEHEASSSAAESKLKAAAAEQRAADARAAGLERELKACEGRLEESARLLASNQQVIKWLNKELNDAQLIPGAPNMGTGLGPHSTSSAIGGGLYGVDNGVAGSKAKEDKAGPRGRGVMFTAGLRESLRGEGGLFATPSSRRDDDVFTSFEGNGDSGLADDTADRIVYRTPYDNGPGDQSKIITPDSAETPGTATRPRQYSSEREARGTFKAGEDDGLMGRFGEDNVRSIPAF